MHNFNFTIYGLLIAHYVLNVMLCAHVQTSYSNYKLYVWCMFRTAIFEVLYNGGI